ncbi:MAG: sugar ABC transporter permease [Phycisphaerae bacterium]|nr:sugar ABC transporter permease [Phycisphaerae bacterium]
MTAGTRRNLRNGLLFTAPWIVGISVFIVYPIGASFYYSLCDYSVLSPPVFIGLGNYADLLGDRVFFIVLRNTLLYTAAFVVLGQIVALLLAILLNMRSRAVSFYRTLLYAPSLVPQIGAAVIWMWMFNTEYGPINTGFEAVVGWLPAAIRPDPPMWFNSQDSAMEALLFMSLWSLGNVMVIYLAGLQDIPASLYEAAEIDGAGVLARTFNITLPMLSPVMLFNGIMGIIAGLNTFAMPKMVVSTNRYRLGDSISFYVMELQHQAFNNLRMGYASAMAWILFVIVLGLTLLVIRLSMRYVYYEAK